jgi:hypothetical protein
MGHETTTVLLVVSSDERAALERMRARPEQPAGPEDGPWIESIRDLDRGDLGTVVQVELANPGGASEPAEILEHRLQQRMMEIATSGRITS